MKTRHLLHLSAFTALSAWGSIASAQTTRAGYAQSSFEPSERGSDWFANESLDLRGNGRFAVGIVGDYSYRSLVADYNRDNNIAHSTVRNQLTLNAGATVNLFDRLRLGASVPVQVFADGHTAVINGVGYLAPQHEASLGDIRVSADLRVVGEYTDPFQLAVGASLWAPSGQRRQFTGDDDTRFAPHINIAGNLDNFSYALRTSYQYRGLREDYNQTRLGSLWTWGGAVGVRFLDRRVMVGPEIYGQTVISNDHAFDKAATPMEALLGAHVDIAPGVRVNAGAGTFVTHGYGAPSLRTTLGIEFFPDYAKPDRDKDGIPDERDACPDVAGVPTNDPKTNGCPPPPPDRDGDGIVDSLDACPDVAGIKTDDAATNGCPDKDNDGVPDQVDACIDVPGVKTNDPKTNGCPPDKDGDGILDKDDACPDVAGIKTDDPKTNGCPDTDRDKDGILNDDDACPDEAGQKTADPKTNGCPRVFIKNAQIQILEQPKFDFNKSSIKKDSDSLLTEVAKVMTDHPEIKKVLVEGHTDNVGNADYNKKLSLQRADSVVKWLSAHGVAADRLSAVGIGKERPLVANDTEANRALNRRVEFHIQDQDATTKAVIKGPDGAVTPATPPSSTQPKP